MDAQQQDQQREHEIGEGLDTDGPGRNVPGQRVESTPSMHEKQIRNEREQRKALIQ